MGRCLLWSGIPFSIAKTNHFYQPMFGIVVVVSSRYKAPTFDDSRRHVLQAKKVDCTQRLEEFKESWGLTRCTVMSDGWIDQKGRSLLNFLLSCPRGIMFIRSVDASTQIKMQRCYVSYWMGSSKR